MDTNSVTIDTVLEDVQKAGGLSPTDLANQEQKILGERKENTEKATNAITRGEFERERLFAKEIKPPAQPQLRSIPQAPQQNFRDPMEGAGGPAMLLAGIASLFTRRPLTSALNAAAASMEAFHQGDKERMENERQKWKDQVEVALKQNQQELDKYRAAMEAAHLTQQERMAKMQAIAASSSDEVLKASIRNGDLDQASKILEGRQKAAEGLAEKLEVARLRASIYGSRGSQTAQEASTAKDLVDDVLAGKTIQYGGVSITKADLDEILSKPKPATGWNAKQEVIRKLIDTARKSPNQKVVGGHNAPSSVPVPPGMANDADGTQYRKKDDNGVVWVWEKRGKEIVALYPENQKPKDLEGGAPATAPGIEGLGAQVP